MHLNYHSYIYFIDGVPEYVGKGTKSRALSHVPLSKRAKTHWHRHLRNALEAERHVIIEMYFHETNDEACTHEILMIAVYGRRNLETGTLYNRTDGGEGNFGMRHSDESKRIIGEKSKLKVYSEETLRRMSESMKGRETSPETRAKLSAANIARDSSKHMRGWNKGRSMPLEQKQLISKSLMGRVSAFKGKNHSPEAREAIRQKATGRKHTEEFKLEASARVKQLVWFNNGVEEFRLREDQPHDDLIEGRLSMPDRRIVLQCPHCPMSGISSNMTRYHFDNCKLKS